MFSKKQIEYASRLIWTGNRGTGTTGYKEYDRTWDLKAEGKPVVHCSNDPLLGGDETKYNPEDLMLSAISSCHMLWYLHLCSDADITVSNYEDFPTGVGEMEPSGKGKFLSATLRPKIEITKDSDIKKAHAIHNEIHKYCFIARSVNFPVTCEPEISYAGL